MSKRLDRAVSIVESRGIALVYPLANRKDLPSLWGDLHPRAEMRWSWDAGADDRVVALWHLKNELAASGRVAYAKWFRGRATFFSLGVFHALLGRFAEAGNVIAGLPRAATEILELLRERSPLSTKELRAEADLRGKAQERVFVHAMKALWSRLLVVGIGEVEDGAFPSLAVSATEMMFEDVWLTREEVPSEEREALAAALGATPAFAKELGRALAGLRAPDDG